MAKLKDLLGEVFEESPKVCPEELNGSFRKIDPKKLHEHISIIRRQECQYFPQKISK